MIKVSNERLEELADACRKSDMWGSEQASDALLELIELRVKYEELQKQLETP